MNAEDVKADACTYSFLCIKRSLVGTDNLSLFDGKVVSWQDPHLVRIRPEEEAWPGGFNINAFSFTKAHTRSRSIVCNTVGWCPTCRKFHSFDDNHDGFNKLWYGKDDFLANCQALFDRFRDNKGWVISDCPLCKDAPLAGYVYVAKTNGAVKIGISKSDPKKRIASIQTSCPWPVELHRSYRCNRVRDVESAAHRALSKHRMRGEWFAIDPEQAMSAVELAIKRVA